MRQKPAHPNYNDQTPEAALYRARQADIDCDIEGMAKDDELSALTDKWIAEGLPAEECIRRLKDALRNMEEPSLAAE